MTASPTPGGFQTLLPTPDPMPPADLSRLLDVLRDNVAGVFLGKPEVIRFAILALLADGHLLLEDLEQILSDLYIEKISIENRIHNLETLVRMHQVLSVQKTVDSLHDVELQIYNIFGFKSGSD